MIYLSLDQSFGAAQAVAQWARWKTAVWSAECYASSGGRVAEAIPGRPWRRWVRKSRTARTLLDAVLLGLALALLLLNALDAVVEVVLCGCALRRVLALCDHQVSLYAGTGCAPLGSMAVLTTMKCLVGAHGQEFEFELEARTSRGVTDLPRESPWGRQSPPHLPPPPPPLPLPPHRPPRPR